MYKQLIVFRKELKNDADMLAAYVGHVSKAFIINAATEKYDLVLDCSRGKVYDDNGKVFYYGDPQLEKMAKRAKDRGDNSFYFEKLINGGYKSCEPKCHIETTLKLDNDMVDEWLLGCYNETLFVANSESQIDEIISYAEAIGLHDQEDYFCMSSPEYNGSVMCIGFKPLQSEVVDQILNKFNNHDLNEKCNNDIGDPKTFDQIIDMYNHGEHINCVARAYDQNHNKISEKWLYVNNYGFLEFIFCDMFHRPAKGTLLTRPNSKFSYWEIINRWKNYGSFYYYDTLEQPPFEDYENIFNDREKAV